jgi:hypothetical protein
MPIGDGSIARAIGTGLKERFPIGGAILETLGPEAVKAITGQSQESTETIAARLETAATRNPEIINSLNLESPLQSGTTLGMAGALLTAAGALYAVIFEAGVYDPAVLGPLCGTILASLFGLWRRWVPNLKPLFSRK